MSFNNANIVSKTYTGNQSFPAARGREYFMIQAGATTTDLTVTFGNGTGAVKVIADGFYEPYIAPSSTIDVVTTGSFVVVTNV